MLKSVAFYPEYVGLDALWDNLEKVKAGGIDAVRFGEFAWGLIEPEEGRFDWEIFDAAFNAAEELGIWVVLGTPTACPPAWLCEKYPGVLPVNSRGETIGFGARQHRCYNSPDFRRAAENVTAALAKRYGARKSLLAWQIDNELAAEHKYCYCDTCKEKFQDFLKDKYKTIEAVNRRWLGSFWAQNYQHFGQIPVPKRLDAYLPMRNHPSLMYEFLRFSSASVVDFCNNQAGIIRWFSKKPITTNQDDFYYGDNVDIGAIFRDLDFASFDVYTEKMYELGFYQDLYRNLKPRPYWMMEFGAASPVLAQAMNQAKARGCELLGLFSFNPFPAGQEQGFGAMLDLFGNPLPNYGVFRDWQPAAPVPTPARKAYLYYDFDSAWAYNVAEYHTWEEGFPQIFSRLVYKDYLLHTVYRALFEAGLQVDILTGPQSLEGLAADAPLLVPMHIIHNRRAGDALLDFMRRGGVVAATADLFLKNEDNAYCTEMPPFYRAVTGENARYVRPAEGETAAYAHGDGRLLLMDAKAPAGSWLALV